MTIQLGLSGFEIDLVQESLVLTNVTLEDTSSVSLSANSTRHKDYKSVKRSFLLSYDVISKVNFDALNDIYDSQVSNLRNLNYIIEESGGLKTYEVQMSPVSRGSDLRDKQYYNGISIELNEV